MDLCEDKIRKSLEKLNDVKNSSDIKKLLKQKVRNILSRGRSNFKVNSFQELTSQHVDAVVQLLCTSLQEDPQLAYPIRAHFSFLLLPVVSKFLEDSSDISAFQRKCVALSILAETNQQVLR